MAHTKLLSLQVGLPRTHGRPGEKTYHSAIVKDPASGPLWLGQSGLTGDGQANRKVHGGPDKAINAYPAEHYPHWQRELSRPEIRFGAFGENFTTQGLLEKEVCVGDIYVVGQALVQISQPRQPCGTLARHWQVRNFVELVNAAGMTGWYFRVLREGQVQAGDDLMLHERLFPEWTITRANAVVAGPLIDPALTRALIACPALSEAWQDTLVRKLS